MTTKRGKAGAKKRIKDLDTKARAKKVKGGAMFVGRDGNRILGRDVPGVTTGVTNGVDDAVYTHAHDGIRP